MKRLLLASVAFAAFGAIACGSAPGRAADMPPSMPPPRAPASYVPFFTWTGPYVGINVGYGWGNSNWTVPTSGLTTGDFNVNGAVAGGTIGYNWQTGSWVLGGESDFDWSGIRGSVANAACSPTCETKNTWLGTSRVRVGYAWDRLMPYFTGGLAFGNVKVTDGGNGSSTTKFGWTFGGGVEYAIMGAWTAKIEYLYVDLGKMTCDTTCSGGGAPFDVKFNTNIIRGGVNYKF